jgi:hypothetical protein
LRVVELSLGDGARAEREWPFEREAGVLAALRGEEQAHAQVAAPDLAEVRGGLGEGVLSAVASATR